MIILVKLKLTNHIGCKHGSKSRRSKCTFPQRCPHKQCRLRQRCGKHLCGELARNDSKLSLQHAYQDA